MAPMLDTEISSPVYGGVGGVGHNKIRSRIKRNSDSDEEDFDDDFLFEPIVLSLSSSSSGIRDPAAPPRGTGKSLSHSGYFVFFESLPYYCLQRCSVAL